MIESPICFSRKGERFPKIKERKTTMTDLTTMDTTMVDNLPAIIPGETAKRITKDGEYDRRHDNPGRPEIFGDKWGIVEALKIINDANGFYHYDQPKAAVSRFLTLQLVDKGFLEIHKAKVTQGPGRAKMFYRLTGKGRAYLALSARWKQ
jgi:hypothetical protein